MSISNGVTGGKARGPIGSFALKYAETFLVADAVGDIEGGDDGLFRNDTRVLSCFRLKIGGAPPSLLGSDVSHDNVFFHANLTNRPLPKLGDQSGAPKGVIHIERSRFLLDERLFERITLTNFNEGAVAAAMAFEFAADFADIFEVRGQQREARGEHLPAEVGEGDVVLRYRGLDGRLRSTAIAFSQTPHALDSRTAAFEIALKRHERFELYVEIGPAATVIPTKERFRHAAARARMTMRHKRRRGSGIKTSSHSFDIWIDKARADLALLETQMDTGPYPFAGIPWFSTPFGRDGIVTALETLWLDPALARGVLAYLAKHQAHEFSTFYDSAPGKIMHETRRGEMSALGEVPFARYYGGVDTTPLFVMLAGAYARRTADLAFIDGIWPALNAAMAWTERAGDSNGDGLLDYLRGEQTGLANQGWKDSFDSIFHADGTLPKGPIALIEVQGFVYAARLAMAELSRQRKDVPGEARWRQLAEELRLRVETRFWMPEHGFYGIALDGVGELCRVLASNAGQLLYTGLPSFQRAQQVTERLLSTTFDSGWGLRTLGEGAPRFNPMSYHDGSVWPHDTALCAAGMARYGHRDSAVHMLNQMFAAAQHFGMRMPELFCGFTQVAGEPPVGYPVACLPQAWSSGAIFMLMQACLGVDIDAWKGVIHVDRPQLPIGIDRLTINGVEVGDKRGNLAFKREGDRVVVSASGLALA